MKPKAETPTMTMFKPFKDGAGEATQKPETSVLSLQPLQLLT